MNLCDFCQQSMSTDVAITHDRTFFPAQGCRGPVTVRLSFTIPIANGTMGASICTKCARSLVSLMIPSPTVDPVELLVPGRLPQKLGEETVPPRFVRIDDVREISEKEFTACLERAGYTPHTSSTANFDGAPLFDDTCSPAPTEEMLDKAIEALKSLVNGDKPHINPRRVTQRTGPWH